MALTTLNHQDYKPGQPIQKLQQLDNRKCYRTRKTIHKTNTLSQPSWNLCRHKYVWKY